MSYYKKTIEILSTEFKLLVTYDFVDGYRGASECGVPIEPDVPSSVEIVNVLLDADGTGQWVCLSPSDEEIEALEDEIMESLQ